MKKIIGAAFFWLLILSAAYAQPTVPQTPVSRAIILEDSSEVVQGPSILFENQKVDFGEIKQGDIVEHTFTFTNNGTQPVVIKNVRTTCGCTATDYPKTPVQPGASSFIKAKFNSTAKKGPQNKVITIESNAVQGNMQVLLVTKVITAAD